MGATQVLYRYTAIKKQSMLYIAVWTSHRLVHGAKNALVYNPSMVNYGASVSHRITHADYGV